MRNRLFTAPSIIGYSSTSSTSLAKMRKVAVQTEQADIVAVDPAEQVKSEVSEIFETLQGLREEIVKVAGRLEGQENVSIEQQNTDASVLALEVAGLRESIDEDARLPVAMRANIARLKEQEAALAASSEIRETTRVKVGQIFRNKIVLLGGQLSTLADLRVKLDAISKDFRTLQNDLQWLLIAEADDAAVEELVTLVDAISGVVEELYVHFHSANEEGEATS